MATSDAACAGVWPQFSNATGCNSNAVLHGSSGVEDEAVITPVKFCKDRNG